MYWCQSLIVLSNWLPWKKFSYHHRCRVLPTTHTCQINWNVCFRRSSLYSYVSSSSIKGNGWGKFALLRWYWFNTISCVYFILLDGVAHHIRTNCYSNIRKYLQDEELQRGDATTTDHVPSSKKRKILHRFLDEDDDHDGKTGFDVNEYINVMFSLIYIEEQPQPLLDENNFHVDDVEVELTHKIGFRRSSSSSSLSTEFSYSTNYRAHKPDELDQYLEADLPSSIVQENPLEFWSSDLASVKFPSLKRLTRRILSIPATSSGTERLFSLGGVILTNRRQRLSPDQVDNMLVIRGARQVLSKTKQADWMNNLLYFVPYFNNLKFTWKKTTKYNKRFNWILSILPWCWNADCISDLHKVQLKNESETYSRTNIVP